MPATIKQRTQFLEMITEWKQSGLTQKSFCINHSIPYHVFHYWYGVYKTEQQVAGSFLPVKIRPACIPEQIVITGSNGIQLQVPMTDQAIGFLKQLLRP